jgi:hypothetical protein
MDYYIALPWPEIATSHGMAISTINNTPTTPLSPLANTGG